MSDSCEIDVEVAGSIGTANELRRASSVEESSQERTHSRCVVRKMVQWRIFKNILFLICLTFLIIQSVQFFHSYYKYPSDIEQETIVAKEFKFPAITFCFRSTMSYRNFCLYEPDRCERPSNMKEFCSKHPFHCRKYNSLLKIPMQDFETRRIMQTYLFNDSYNDASLFQGYEYASKVRTFIKEFGSVRLFLKCYSANLHLYQSGSKPQTKKLDFDNEDGDFLSWNKVHHLNIEPFYPPDTPQVFVAIHSPYVPLNHVVDLHPVWPYKDYRIYVQLEKEEHLLPPPYRTDCRDNGPSKDAKESTNPNSFQMCLDLCRSEYNKARFGCGFGMTMRLSVRDLCKGDYEEPNLSSMQVDELKKKRLVCFQNCKQGCLKLQYKSAIQEIDRDIIKEKNPSEVYFYVKNPEVIVLRHVPVYNSGDIFSHIGGLLGCWLGISVFTFTDIVEKFSRKVVRWKKKFRKEEEQRTPTSEIHQD